MPLQCRPQQRKLLLILSLDGDPSDLPHVSNTHSNDPYYSDTNCYVETRDFERIKDDDK